MSLVRSAVVALSALVFVACGGGGGAGGGAAGAGGTGGAAGAGGTGGAAGAGGTGGAAGAGGAGGTGGAAGMGGGGQGGAMSLLAGEWKPTFFDDSGMGTMPVPEGSPYFVFGADQSFAIGCGSAPIGTWAWNDAAPAPAIGIVEATLGSNNPISWYVLELTDTTFSFAEGGDISTFERSACP
jgi:hypothetical protein